MKRLFVIVVVLAALGVLAIPAGAQSSPRAVITIPNADNNNFISAYGFHPYADMIVQEVQNASIEGTEPEHSCAPGATTKSVWFYSYLDAGTVTIDTTGTQYIDGVTISPNSVVSLYLRNGNYSGNIANDLDFVACNDSGSGPGIISNSVLLVSGQYYIQVSASTGISSVNSSAARVRVSYTASDGPSNDEPSGAKALKFPSLPTITGFNRATTAVDEPVDPDLVDSMTMDPLVITNTVWYTFTIDSPRLVGAQSFFDGGPVLGLSLFRETGSTLTHVAGGEYSFIAFVSEGTYFLRVGALYAEGGSSSFFATILNILYLVPHGYEFSVGASEGSSPGTPSMSGWTVKNDSPGEDAICDAAPPYDCYFLFTSSGADEATKLIAKFNLSSTKVKSGDIVLVQAAVSDYTGTPNFTAMLKLIDAVGGKQKYAVNGTELLSSPLLITTAPGSIKPVTAKLIVKNKDTDPGDQVHIDGVISAVLRTGEGRSQTDLLNKLPLFGTVPSAWQTQSSSPKSVLPVPPAP